MTSWLPNGSSPPPSGLPSISFLGPLSNGVNMAVPNEQSSTVLPNLIGKGDQDSGTTTSTTLTVSDLMAILDDEAPGTPITAVTAAITFQDTPVGEANTALTVQDAMATSVSIQESFAVAPQLPIEQEGTESPRITDIPAIGVDKPRTLADYDPQAAEEWNAFKTVFAHITQVLIGAPLEPQHPFDTPTTPAP